MMPIRHLSEIVAQARRIGPVTVAIAAAEDQTVLAALAEAEKLGIARAILIGDGRRIDAIYQAAKLVPNALRVVHEPDPVQSARIAARLVGSGEADCLMKGLVHTSDFMRAVLSHESQLSAGKLLSHVGLLESPLMGRILLFTDGAVTIYPSFDDKVQLIHNLLPVTRVLGLAHPRIAVLAAIESVYDRMISTKDAARLAAMGLKGGFAEGIVDGPLGLDIAVSSRAAEHKGVESEVAGRADALVCPDLESAIALGKSAVYLGGVRNGGVVIGATAPIVLTSRSDVHQTKLVSIALAALLARANPQH